MSYSVLLNRLFSLTRFKGGKKGLSTAIALSEHFGHPERSFSSVHIAGTNGKGSVTTKIARSCTLSGLKTGLFTSPHLFAFEERVQIDNVLISKEQVIEKLSLIFEVVDQKGLNVTFFEIVTFLAFLYFREEKVDIAIIETGLGGRLDATNVLSPLLSIITTISREHVQQLGETLEEIAYEKAGIIKRKIPVVIGPKAKLKPILEKARKMASPIYLVKDAHQFYDAENRAIAEKALEVLSNKLALNAAAIEEGIKQRPKCRFELKENILFDVAHNPHGFLRLKEALKMHYPNKKLRFVVGMSPTKEIEACLEIIAKEGAPLHLVQSQDRMTLSPSELEKSLLKIEAGSYFLEKNIESGIKNAKAAALEDELIVVCGSFYIMLESYLHFGKQN